MAALEWFEWIDKLRIEVARLDGEIESAYCAAGPHGQQMGSVGGGFGEHDAMASVDAMLDSDAQRKLEQRKGRLIRLTDRACDVLYGKSGRGGVAKAIGTDEADMLCFHYLQGESWADIARRYDADAKNLSDWAKCRARWTCRQIDRIGIDELAES